MPDPTPYKMIVLQYDTPDLQIHLLSEEQFHRILYYLETGYFELPPPPLPPPPPEQVCDVLGAVTVIYSGGIRARPAPGSDIRLGSYIAGAELPRIAPPEGPWVRVATYVTSRPDLVSIT